MKVQDSLHRALGLLCGALVLGLGMLSAPAFAQGSVPARWTNSLGQVFVPIPKTTVRFCIWETRKADYDAFVREGHWGRLGPRPPEFEQKDDHPVVNVSWQDAKGFCIWLTEREQKRGLLSSNQVYRLPTEREWIEAAALPDSPKFLTTSARAGQLSSFNQQGTVPGNFAGNDPHRATAPVGSFPPNKHGIYDLAGNAWEWCMDLENDGRRNIMRGGSWRQSPLGGLHFRDYTLPDGIVGDVGFRVVLVDAPSHE